MAIQHADDDAGFFGRFIRNYRSVLSLTSQDVDIEVVEQSSS